MRCSKCGYENTTGTTCVKCGTPLGINDYKNNQREVDADLQATRIMRDPIAETEQLKSTVVQNDVSNLQLKSTVIQSISDKDTPFKSTVIQKDSKSLFKDDNEQLECPKCGYPVAANFSNCPNCGADFMVENESSSVQPIVMEKQEENKHVNATVGINAKKEGDETFEFCNICDQCHAEVSAEFSFCPHCGTKIVLKTIPVIHCRQKKVLPEDVTETPIEKICYLTLIPEDGEQIESVKTTYKGTSIVLNRENTESDNRTITSKEQAILNFENGRWYIENRSELDSTLIVVGRKLELNSSDIIMLGNRRFKFETE